MQPRSIVNRCHFFSDHHVINQFVHRVISTNSSKNELDTWFVACGSLGDWIACWQFWRQFFVVEGQKFQTRCKKGNFCTLCNFGETLDCMASSGPLHFVTTPIAAQLIGTLWSPRSMEVKIWTRKIFSYVHAICHNLPNKVLKDEGVEAS